MKLENLLIEIPQYTGNVINQSLLAEALGVTRQTISNRIKNGSQVTVQELEKIEDYFNISFYKNKTNEYNTESIIYIDYYSDIFASCGQGKIIFSAEKTQVPISPMLINNYSKNKTYSMINASGNSMSPTIENNDKLIIEHWTGSQIIDNRIYTFCFNNEMFVKRLSKNFDELIIKSDNPEYRIRTINGSTINDIFIIGKVVSVIKTL